MVIAGYSDHFRPSSRRPPDLGGATRHVREPRYSRTMDLKMVVYPCGRLAVHREDHEWKSRSLKDLHLFNGPYDFCGRRNCPACSITPASSP